MSTKNRPPSHSAALDMLDKQSFSCYHVKAILVAGVGFFTDAYDLFIINLVVPMIGWAYFDGKLSAFDDSIMKGAAPVGTLLGQLFFGILADRLGRKKMYGVELAMVILGTFCCALASNTARGMGVVGMVTFWRFLIGLGVGGDYPLSATITSEYANVSRRGQMMAAVFAMQGFGILAAAVVALATLVAFQTAIESDSSYIDDVWRICVGAGIIPALATVYFRVTLPETPRYTMHVKGSVYKALRDVRNVTNRSDDEILAVENGSSQAVVNSAPTTAVASDERPKASLKDFRAYIGKPRNAKILFGCCASWFCLDIAFYGLGLNQAMVLKSIGFVPSSDNATVCDQAFKSASGNALISIMGTVPGYWLSVLLMERMGRIKIQLLGFAVLTTVFIILAAAFDEIVDFSMPLFIAFYCIAMFFFNFGPNTTTFIVPGEVFTTRYRSTGHGIAAASGKAGAIIAAYSFPAIQELHGVRALLAICAGATLLGLLATLLVPETRGKSLEQLAGESDAGHSKTAAERRGAGYRVAIIEAARAGDPRYLVGGMK